MCELEKAFYLIVFVFAIRSTIYADCVMGNSGELGYIPGVDLEMISQHFAVRQV